MRIATSASVRIFDRHDFLFMQGQTGHRLMLIQSGTVKLTQLSSGGEEVILWMTGEREPIGFMLDPVEGKCRYTCSAQAMEKVCAVVWEYERFQVFLDQFPRIRANMNSILFARLEELQERFREIATERVAKRLAMALLRLSRQVGRPHQAGIQVQLSRAELAQLVGTTLFTISRILSKWDEEGIVLARREAVVVCNTAFLENHPDAD
ncbi:MAG TPA: Crp/Fnr family transcriptional regulator [Terracidiphilus sp.]